MSDSKTNGAGNGESTGLINRVRSESKGGARRWPKVVLALLILGILGAGAGFVFLKGSGLGQKWGLSAETDRAKMRRFIELGQKAYKAKDYAAAAKHYEQATEARGNVADPYRLWGICLMQQNTDLDRAEELFREAIALAPQDDISRLHLAKLYFHSRQNPTQCLRVCQEALDSPRSAGTNRDFPREIYWIAAQAAAALGQTDDALKLASSFAEMASRSPQPCLLIAGLHMNRWLVDQRDTDLKQAEDALERGLQRVDNLRKAYPSKAAEYLAERARFLQVRGKVHDEQKNLRDAVSAYEEGLAAINEALGPNQETKGHPTPHVVLKVRLLDRLERYDEALKFLTDQYHAEPRPDLVEHRVTMRMKAFKGDRKALEETLALVAQAKEDHPKYSTPFTVLEMRVHHAAGQAAQADERAAAAAEGTDNPDIWKALIGVRAQEVGDVEAAERSFRQSLEANPDNMIANLGLLQIEGNRYLKALGAGPAGNAAARRERREAVKTGREAFEKALAVASEHVNASAPKLRLWQGVRLLFSGTGTDIDAAREVLAKVVNTAPNLADAHMFHGIACQRSAARTDDQAVRDALLRDAIKSFRGLIAAERRSARAAGGDGKATERSQGALLDTYRMTGQLREAILLGKKVVDEYPEGRSLRWSYGLALHKHGDYILAEKQFRTLTERFPNWGPAWGMLGQSLYLQSGRLAEAEEAMSKGLLIDNRLEIRQIVARFFYTRGDKRRAKSEYLQIVEQFPGDPRSYFLLGTFYHLVNEKDLAREAFEKGIEVDPDHLPNLAAAGDTYLTGPRPTPEALGKATDYATRILMKKPGDPHGRILLARALIARREIGEAKGVLDEFLDEFPDSIMGRALLATAMMSTAKPDLEKVRTCLEEILKRNPNHAMANSLLAHVESQEGMRAIREGSLEAANKHFQAAVNRNPGNVDDRLKLAGTHLGLARTNPAKLDLAIQEGRRIVKGDANRYEGHVFLGAILSRRATDRGDKREADEAMGHLREGIKLAPKLAGPHIAMAEHHARNKRWKDACESYYEALNYQPKHIGALQGLIVCLAQQDRWDQAESICRRRLDENVDETGIETFLLGQVLEGQKKPAEALKSYRAAIAINPRIEIAVERIVRLLANDPTKDRLIDEALAAVRKALEGYPESAYYPVEIGYLLLVKKDFEAARASFETAIERNPGVNRAYLGLVNSYSAQGKLKEAAEQLHLFLREQPKLGFLWFLSAQIQEQLGNTSTAGDHYSKAIDINPNNHLARNNLAWILVWHDDQPESAFEQATKAIEGLPKNPNVMDTLAWIQVARGKFQAALDLLTDPGVEKALGNQAHYQYHRGRALLELGRDNDARLWLDKARKTADGLPKPDEKLSKDIDKTRSRIK
jgi:tetratricopeptide (TPR) repeat protein